MEQCLEQGQYCTPQCQSHTEVHDDDDGRRAAVAGEPGRSIEIDSDPTNHFRMETGWCTGKEKKHVVV